MQVHIARLLLFVVVFISMAACQPVTAPAERGVVTGTATTTAGARAPQATIFTVEPNSGLAVGDVFTATWQVEADSLSLCMIDGTGPIGCEPQPLSGQKAITVTQAMLATNGMGLSATNGSTIFAMQDLHFACAAEWFFADPPQTCPEGPPIASYASYQPFEHGFMLWTAAPDSTYAMFEDDRTYLGAGAPYAFVPAAEMPLAPPAGLLAPWEHFEHFWRSELAAWSSADVRGRLGWATAPETGYTSLRQCELSTYPGMWACYLQAPDGRVFVTRPDSTAKVHYVWDWR